MALIADGVPVCSRGAMRLRRTGTRVPRLRSHTLDGRCEGDGVDTGSRAERALSAEHGASSDEQLERVPMLKCHCHTEQTQSPM